MKEMKGNINISKITLRIIWNICYKSFLLKLDEKHLYFLIVWNEDIV